MPCSISRILSRRRGNSPGSSLQAWNRSFSASAAEKSPDRHYRGLWMSWRRTFNYFTSKVIPRGTYIHRMKEDNASETPSMTAKDREEIRRRTSASAGTVGAAAIAVKAGTRALPAGAAAHARHGSESSSNVAKTSAAAGAPASIGVAGAETGSLVAGGHGDLRQSSAGSQRKTGKSERRQVGGSLQENR